MIRQTITQQITNRKKVWHGMARYYFSTQDAKDFAYYSVLYRQIVHCKKKVPLQKVTILDILENELNIDITEIEFLLF